MESGIIGEAVTPSLSVSHMGPLTKSELALLTEKLKSITWILKTTHEGVDHYWTGFSISKHIVMTTVSGCSPLSSKIKARRMDMEGFSYTAIVAYRSSWDIMLLKVDHADCAVGKLASNGSIFDGETLLSMTNSNQLVGSLAIGRASYRCLNDVILPSPQDQAQCGNHKFSASFTTPSYRQMGHAWNQRNFSKFNDQSVRKYMKFHPAIPIILCGFRFHPNASGAPVFNTQGEIVGMLNSNLEFSAIAIHVTLLKEFLKELKRPTQKSANN